MKNDNNKDKLSWETPKLEKLGLMKDLVQEGRARGKSGPLEDGSTSGMNESKD